MVGTTYRQRKPPIGDFCDPFCMQVKCCLGENALRESTGKNIPEKDIWIIVTLGKFLINYIFELVNDCSNMLVQKYSELYNMN